jgi:hypothetical protein
METTVSFTYQAASVLGSRAVELLIRDTVFLRAGDKYNAITSKPATEDSTCKRHALFCHVEVGGLTQVIR